MVAEPHVPGTEFGELQLAMIADTTTIDRTDLPTSAFLLGPGPAPDVGDAVDEEVEIAAPDEPSRNVPGTLRDDGEPRRRRGPRSDRPRPPRDDRG